MAFSGNNLYFSNGIGEVKKEVKAILSNSLGQVILTKQLISTDIININIDGPRGLYLLQIQSSDGENKTVKILKE